MSLSVGTGDAYVFLCPRGSMRACRKTWAGLARKGWQAIIVLPVAVLLDLRTCWNIDDVREIVVYLWRMSVHLGEIVVYLRKMVID
jgi:hypothetical protein